MPILCLGSVLRRDEKIENRAWREWCCHYRDTATLPCTADGRRKPPGKEISLPQIWAEHPCFLSIVKLLKSTGSNAKSAKLLNGQW